MADYVGYPQLQGAGQLPLAASRQTGRVSDDEMLGELAREQASLVTRRQAHEAGLSDAAIRWRTGHMWRLVLPSVIATSSTPLSPRQLMVAACLEAGPDGIISGHHACAWHGLTAARVTGPVLVLVPVNQANRQVGFVQIRRTKRLDSHPFERPPVRIASRARAVVDACRAADHPDHARALVIEAVQRRLVRLDDLEHELAAGGLRFSAAARNAVREARAGAWSVPEADLLRLVRTSHVLPRAWPNPRITAPDGTCLISPDAWFDDVGMAVMVHSRTHHLREQQWEETVHYDGQLAEYGVIVIGVTPRSIHEQPAEVLRRIERVYLAAARTGRHRPPLQMDPRGWGVASA